jgi:diguanylate cyclase (GGDEF)-like protein
VSLVAPRFLPAPALPAHHRDAAEGISGLANSVECRVTRDRALALYAHDAGGLMVTAVSSVFLVIMVVSPANRSGLLGWLAAVFFVLAGRTLDVAFLHPLRRRRTGELDGKREIACFAVGMLSSATLWALFPVIFFPTMDESGRTAASVVLAAMAGGSATVLGPSLPLAITYCTALLLSPGLVFFTLSGRENVFLGMLTLALLVTTAAYARVANRLVIKSLRLSHINQALVRQSEQQRRETEAANERLATAQVALADANQTLERRIELRTADLEHEVAERQRYAEALARLASTDPLTGLWNRTTFAERLACMLADADAGGTRLAVVFLDLDNFKQVNDVRGHTAGDQVLQTSAHLLSQAADDTVQLARWGGDEFVMAVPITRDSQSVVQMATSLRHVLMRPLNAGIDAVRIDATVGIAIFPEDGRTQDELIRAADVAMYEAKKEGKGRVKLFDPALARNVTERHRLEQALREAMARNEFSLAYQPIISTATGGCKAFEALLRWQHPELGSIGPSTFIPIAEQTGQIATIGRWVLIEACKAAASWPDQTLSVTVNASVAQAVSGMLLDDVEDALAQTGLSATRLEIEITESMFVSDHVRVAPIFEDLRRRGIRVLLDDFGTGFSSLAYLGKLPLDVIKIDQNFVRTADRDGYAIIQAILSIADALALEVTAEGVETAAQQDTLTAMGVDNLQGFLLGRPMPGPAVANWLRSRNAPQARALGMVEPG